MSQNQRIHVSEDAPCNFFDRLDEDAVVLILMHLRVKQLIRTSSVCKQFQALTHEVLCRKLNLESEQVKCLVDVLKGENVFITGGAGCGKSHVLKTIIKCMGHENVAITASTGCAAAILGASTFHSACGLGLGKAPARVIVQNIVEGFRSNYSRLRSMKALVVDEVGMLTGDLFDKAGEVIGLLRRSYARKYDAMMVNAQATTPFDNVQIILCGDALQLPPVNVESEKWIFDAKCWQKLDFKVHVLKHVHRQQNAKFIEILQRMRVGESKLSDLSYLIQNSAKQPIEGSLKLFALNCYADCENDEKMKQINATRHLFNSIDSAKEPNTPPQVLGAMLKHCPAQPKLELKVGARVMCLKNIIEGQLVNGSVGTVKEINHVYFNEGGNPTSIRYVVIVVEFDGHLGEDSFEHRFQTHVPGEEVSQENVFAIYGQNHKKVAQRIQIPLRLAWAISIHKSQGQSLSNVSIDFSNTFSAGQAYTALSRVKCIETAYIRGLKMSHMRMVDPRASQFYSSAS